MSLAISTLKPPPHFPFNLSSLTPPLSSRIRNHVIPFPSSSIRAQSLKPEYARNPSSFSHSILGFSIHRKQGFRLSAENGEGGGGGERKSMVEEGYEEARKESTSPEQFKVQVDEIPQPLVRWPFFVAIGVLLYAWRTVLWELSNWKKAVASIPQFVGYLFKLALALNYLIGDPITFLIRGIETTLYTIRAFYSAVISYTPVPELILIIILVSSVFAIAEASVPDSVNSQPYLLTIGGIIGFAAVRGFFSELSFWTLLLGLFGFARFVKKRDYVSSVLPVAAVLAAVGEPWVRVVAMASYLALAITHHSKRQSEDKDGGEAAVLGRKVPIPLFCAALAIGIRVAAKWAGYRHLTWMIV